MIVKIKPVNAKVNVSRQNGESETTETASRGNDIDHTSNIGVLGNLRGYSSFNLISATTG